MRISQPVAVLILLFPFAICDECGDKCADNYVGPDANSCKDGCRLALVYSFGKRMKTESPEVIENCHKGCVKSLGKKSIKPCFFGCENQNVSNAGEIRVSFSQESPLFNVAADVFRKAFSRLSNPSSFFGFGDSAVDSIRDPIEEMRQHMHREMLRLREMTENLFNLHNGNNLAMVVHRPSGHMRMRGEHGREPMHRFSGVGNADENGEQIIVESIPKQSYHLLGHQGENPMHPTEDPSWMSRIAFRARRLSMMNQWLIFAALFICFISLLSISAAIMKQIRCQKYRNLRNARVLVPTTIVQPLPAKKIPLESGPSPHDYPLIHDTPPPAYDQLSIHKDKETKPETD